MAGLEGGGGGLRQHNRPSHTAPGTPARPQSAGRRGTAVGHRPNRRRLTSRPLSVNRRRVTDSDHPKPPAVRSQKTKTEPPPPLTCPRAARRVPLPLPAVHGPRRVHSAPPVPNHRPLRAICCPVLVGRRCAPASRSCGAHCARRPRPLRPVHGPHIFGVGGAWA